MFPRDSELTPRKSQISTFINLFTINPKTTASIYINSITRYLSVKYVILNLIRKDSYNQIIG